MPISGYTPEWNAGIVTALGSNLSLAAGTLSATGGGGGGEWNAGTVVALAGALTILSGGTLTDGGTPPPTVVKFSGAASNTHIVLSNGDLTAAGTAVGGNFWYMTLTDYANAGIGDIYYEFVVNANAIAGDPGSVAMGVCSNDYSVADGVYLGSVSDKGWGYYPATGAVYNVGGTGSGTVVFPPAAVADTVSIAFSIASGKAWVRVNGGTWGPSGDPAAHTGGYDWSNCGLTGSEAWTVAGAFGYDGLGQVTANFGHTAFAYTVPAGYSAPGD